MFCKAYSDEVVSWSQAGRNLAGPLEGIEDDTVSPLTLVDGTRQKTGLVNLEPHIS